MVTDAHVTLQLDYCNATKVYMGLPLKTWKLQLIQNAVAQAVVDTSHYVCESLLLSEPHWLLMGFHV